MELSKITKLLLWLLSKRNDIAGIRLHDHDTEVIELPAAEYAELVASLGFDLDPDEITGDGDTAAMGLAFDRDHLQECFDAPSAINPDRPD